MEKNVPATRILQYALFAGAGVFFMIDLTMGPKLKPLFDQGITIALCFAVAGVITSLYSSDKALFVRLVALRMMGLLDMILAGVLLYTRGYWHFA